MTRQLKIILTILTFVACQNNKPDTQLTSLEKYIIETHSLTNNSKTFDKIANHILTNRPELENDGVQNIAKDTNGLLKEQRFKFYPDTTGRFKDLNYKIKIKEYKTDRQAAEAFWKIIEFYACCVPDEDIIKLKNFENLDHFKNCASTTVLVENIVIEAGLGNKREENKELSELIDEILNNKKYLKLEIGTGGPAIWTRK